jgi:hypothetical protein
MCRPMYCTQLRPLPYRVNALLEKRSICTISDKFLHLQEFATTSSETLRIMKDEVVVAPENEFVLDVVPSVLKRVDYTFHVMS